MTIEARFSLRKGEFLLDCRFDVPARGVIAIHGPSGCGKTTLLRAMAGLEPEGTGYLRIGDVVWQDDEVFVPAHRRSLGYVFQEPSLFAHLTVRGNLRYGLNRVDASRRRVRLEEAVSLLGIASLLERKPSLLSGGERQRVAIARALLRSPRLLLMDEPLAALDLASKQEILPCLERLHEELEIPVFYVSHSPDEVARLADHLVLMQDGGVRAWGPIDELLTRVDLPLAHGADAESILIGKVVDRDPAYGLSIVEFPGGRLRVSGGTSSLGASLRLRVLARDVSLTLEHQVNTSILNILPAEIAELSEEGSTQMIVKLDIGGVYLLARVTRKSAHDLGLVVGKRVFAQVKSVAVLT